MAKLDLKSTFFNDTVAPAQVALDEVFDSFLTTFFTFVFLQPGNQAVGKKMSKINPKLK